MRLKKKQNIIVVLSFATMFILLYACKKDIKTNTDTSNSKLELQLPNLPDDYLASNNDHLATLGRVLFYDKNLSLNNSVSCSSCHMQNRAFTDNQRFSTGLEDVKTRRNTPSIFSKTGRVFWDGRSNNIRDLALKPIKNHVEMKFENLSELSKKLNNLPQYQNLFTKAFGNNYIDSTRIASALTEFLLNFNFSNNKFNRSLQKREQLNASEIIGKDIFFGKAHCSDCHHIEGNNGMPLPGGQGYGNTNESFNTGLDMEYTDNGLGELFGPGMNGEFMVPALLNVEYTAPYMHDGRFKTLEEVIEHYNSGVKNHPNLSFFLKDFTSIEHLDNDEIIRKFDLNKNGFIDDFEIQNIPLPALRLGLNASEKRCLIDFLKTLSDPNILSDQKFSNPFVSR